MAKFTTKVSLFKKSVFIKELKVKHFKTILKTLLSNEPDLENVIKNFINILSETTEFCVNEIKNLSILDFLLLILHIRRISIGNIIQLEINNQKNIKFDLDLNKSINTIKNSFNYTLFQTVENIKIEYRLPTIEEFLLPKIFNNELLLLKSYLCKFIINENTIIDILQLDNETFLQILKTLPANYSTKILKYSNQIIQEINQINLLKHLTDKNLTLFLNKENFAFILQILFSKNLLPLYENIFALAKFANLSPEYIEECTPGEYTIFVKILERLLKEQNSTQQQTSITLPSINTEHPNFM